MAVKALNVNTTSHIWNRKTETHRVNGRPIGAKHNITKKNITKVIALARTILNSRLCPYA
ncbi:unnamed protein product [Protopolystoma xenopodis]|uniref:Uncharacterized protein n=1 Tax=Protopolystoma xenopodis TaxID=117903 RepID=A0A448X8H4_9PLAT|nr:unnamed protein product [Protopolystoma xenopodis]